MRLSWWLGNGRTGGWAQIPSLSSDAYATGQSLVALSQSGALAATDAVYKRGIQFLVQTQFEDGSWYVKSRAIPLQRFFEAIFPTDTTSGFRRRRQNWAARALVIRGAVKNQHNTGSKAWPATWEVADEEVRHVALLLCRGLPS